jgi:DNA-binding response OmpR family regulator
MVSDSGDGIDDDEKEAVFQRFYQVRSDSEKAGSGIGLHIVKEYVKMHNGTVRVNDNVPKGTVFVVTIPTNLEDKEVGKTNITGGQEDVKDDVVTDTTEQRNEAIDRYTILVVDDNRDMCNFVANSLSDEYDVLTAGDGEDALNVLKNNDINLVVSDVMMPKIDGIELCKRIKTTMQWSHIPVILLTAKTADVAVIEGLQQGADDYITKPFNIEHLRLRVKKFVEWTNNAHKMFNQKMDVKPSDITITSLDEQFVQNAMRIVEDNISDENFSVETLGKELGMSRTNLYKKLLSITGRGPHDFIRIMRLKRACQLLEKSQMQIAEIAYEVGYSSPKRFSENFKSEYGMTPSQYVKSVNGER